MRLSFIFTARRENAHDIASHPLLHRNYQARPFVSKRKGPHRPDNDALMVPDIGVVQETINSFDWVAVTEFFHESKCLLYYRVQPRERKMQQYLDETCHCHLEEQQGNSTETIKDVTVKHYDGRRRHTMLDLDEMLLQKINAATTTDRPVFKETLRQFMLEINWLEANLGRRVLCDAPLAKWEQEMAYLGVNVTELYGQPHGKILENEAENKQSGERFH